MAKKKVTVKKEKEPFVKTKAKSKIRALKKDRDKAIEGKDPKKLKAVRRTIHNLKRQIKRNKVKEAAQPAAKA